MKMHEERRSRPMRWVIAIVIFVIVLTVTFDDVYGVWLPNGDGSGSGAVQPHPDQPNSSADTKDATPPQVPEPGTILLLGAGVAAMHLLRKRKTA